MTEHCAFSGPMVGHSTVSRQSTADLLPIGENCYRCTSGTVCTLTKTRPPPVGVGRGWTTGWRSKFCFSTLRERPAFPRKRVDPAETVDPSQRAVCQVLREALIRRH